MERHESKSIVGILHELTTSVGINAELQCTLCHEVLCKPVTTPCGHSFCRVCLVEYFLSKELSETQCPICRGVVLHSTLESRGRNDAAVAPPAFSINVTLWNLIQLLVPTMREKDPTDEDADYALKYDQFNAKWRIAALQQAASSGDRRRRRHDNSDDEIVSSDDEMEGALHRQSDSDEDAVDGANQRLRNRYPELRQENTVDGHLEVFRNVVIDRDDANEDGYEGMRVSLAVMEFPSLFQPFNEHQECSIVVLKCEEDEDMDGGIPYFTSDDGDDDTLIVTDYYNEIRLRVTDNVGNVVMERTRGSTQGIATFPNLRLDVPSGMYDFQFKDDLYGIRLTIRTEVRDLREEDDSSEIFDDRPMRLVLDQAGERNRSRSRRHHSSDEDEGDDDNEADSDDSFIVNDDIDVNFEGDGVAQFSGGDDHEGSSSSQDEEDEEEFLERHERSLQERRRHRQEQNGQLRFSQDSVSGESGEGDDEGHDVGLGSGQVEPSESDDEDQPSSGSSGVFGKRNHIVDDDSNSDDDGSIGGNCAQSNAPIVQDNSTGQGKKRSRAIMESDDEETKDENDQPDRRPQLLDGAGDPRPTEPVSGFSSNKRLRQVTSRVFQDEDDEDDYEEVESRRDVDGDENADEAEDTGLQRSRWIGSDPYWPRSRREDVADNGLDGDDTVISIHGYNGVPCTSAHDQSDEEAGVLDDHGSDQSHSEDEDADPWKSSNSIEHDEDEGGYSD